ncbi:MAG: LPS export ABC transporter periplasmic protein LptC [Desulfobacterales bacterium]
MRAVKKKISSKGIKIFLFSLMVLILCIVVFVFAGYRKMRSKSADFVSAVRDGAGMSLSRVYQTASKDGAPAWKLNADAVNYMNEGNQAVFENPSLTFFLRDDRQASLKAGRGMLKTDSNDLEMREQVCMESDMWMLETGQLKYRHDKKLFFSDVPVKITRNGTETELSADSATLDLDARKVWFKGNVRGTFGEDISL